MPEIETVFESKVKSMGIFSFKDLYKFCYDWLVQEDLFAVEELEYGERIVGNAKEVRIKWRGRRKITDYFMFETEVKFEIFNMSDVEVQDASGAKMKKNKGDIGIKIKGNLIRDYDGKWEKGALQKFLRGLYERYVIPARVIEFKERLYDEMNTFSEQVKAFLALEGKK
jgi:hypothetical protein